MAKWNIKFWFSWQKCQNKLALNRHGASPSSRTRGINARQFKSFNITRARELPSVLTFSKNVKIDKKNQSKIIKFVKSITLLNKCHSARWNRRGWIMEVNFWKKITKIQKIPHFSGGPINSLDLHPMGEPKLLTAGTSEKQRGWIGILPKLSLNFRNRGSLEHKLHRGRNQRKRERRTTTVKSILHFCYTRFWW